MKKMINYKKAFTLAECLIVLMTIGVIAYLTIINTGWLKNIENEKTRSVTNIFYTTVQGVYQQMVASDYRGSIKNSTLTNSEGLAKLFVKYMDGELASNCNQLKVHSSDTKMSELLENAKCVTFPSGLIAGIVYDRGCKIELNVWEYKVDEDKSIQDPTQKPNLLRSVTKACGAIMYHPIDKSNGVLGQDLFVIPLGERDVL